MFYPLHQVFNTLKEGFTFVLFSPKGVIQFLLIVDKQQTKTHVERERKISHQTKHTARRKKSSKFSQSSNNTGEESGSSFDVAFPKICKEQRVRKDSLPENKS